MSTWTLKLPQRRTVTKTTSTNTALTEELPQRIQKLLSAQGLGSRRTIEQWITEGKIEVNGHLAKLGDRASLSDTILLNKQQVELSKLIKPCALIYHKPCGEMVTHKDEQDRVTVFDAIPKPQQGRWVSVGRLDFNTSGLLIFCNDGELAKRMMHPTWNFPREYRVRVKGKVDKDMCDRLLSGVSIGNIEAKFSSIEYCPDNTSHGVNRWFKVVLHEGRNREVRRLWESQGVEVSGLHRERFGNWTLNGIELRKWRWLLEEELKVLYARVELPYPLA